MMVVADTGPLQYLILIARIDLLHVFYDTVLLPAAVVRELNGATTPTKVQGWIENRPEWIVVREAEALLGAPRKLGAGEVAAISLAALLGCPLLIDDRDGWSHGKSLGPERIGTLGVLIEAHVEGLDEIRDAVDRLKQTSFHASPGLFERAIEIAERRRDGS